MERQYGPHTEEIRRFLANLERLTLDELTRVMREWRRAVGPVWFDADSRAGMAVTHAGRYIMRLELLDELHEVFRRAPWFKPGAPDSPATGSEASAQYAASTALTALLVSELIEHHVLETLYAPFAKVIPRTRPLQLDPRS
jgi:hypothetical protein